MRKRNIFFILLVCSLFIACEDKDDDRNDLKLNNTSCIITENNPYVIIDILDGVGRYFVYSSNEAIAIAEADENKLHIKGGGKTGSATVTVEDFNGKISTVDVRVKDVVIYPLPLIISIPVKKGTTREFSANINEADCFFYNNNNSIAQVDLREEMMIISGFEIGKTSSYFFENNYPTVQYKIEVVDSYEIKVTDYYGWSLNSNNTVLTSKRHYFFITGNGNYTINLSDDSIIKAEIKPSPYQKMIDEPNFAMIEITTLNVGQTDFTIMDADGKTVSTTFYVR